MTAASRMKSEMTRAGLGGKGQLDLDAQMEAMGLPDADRNEVKKFAAFLGDSSVLPLPELIEVHGAAYLGFTPDEVASINAAAVAQP